MEGRGSAAAGHLAVVAMMLVLAMAPGALAVNHVVGGTQLWDYPPSNDLTYYDSWAANQTFVVGDTLQFQYTQQHDVVQYNTEAEYTACAGTAVNQYTTGNDSIPLTAAGNYFYICSITGHCAEGMKVSVTVGAAIAPASPPTTTPSSPPTTTPSSPPTTTPSSPPTTTPSPPDTTPSPPTGTSRRPPTARASAASSGPVLSMAGLIIAAVVASLAFLV